MVKHSAIEPALTLESAWAFIAAELERREPAGEIVIPSGKDTGLYVRVKPSLIPANVGLELCNQGIRKPLTDISKDAKQGDESWNEPHARRVKKVQLWYGGDYAAKGGGVPDPVSAQMREELIVELKDAGLTDKRLKELEIKGSFPQMVDRLEALGIVKDRKATTDRLRERATARLAERGEAAATVDLGSIQL